MKELMRNKRKATVKRWLIVGLTIIFFIVGVLGVLQLGVISQKRAEAHWRPDYEKIDILPLLEKSERTEEDYAVLYAQTGLTKIGIDDLLQTKDFLQILAIQECYFKKYEINTYSFAPFTYMQELTDYAVLTRLQDGDILISYSAFTSWYRYGHSALVVDGDAGVVLEAVSIGENSELAYAFQFASYTDFLVFRPKVDEEVRKQVAAYAKSELVELPYRLTMGIFFEKFGETVTGTHCAHLVWYAYKKFGIDLDSTGGAIVTPQNMARSPHLELVQSFGVDPNKL